MYQKSKSSPLNFQQKNLSHPRNAFDMSHHSYFTAPTGLLQPCYYQDLIPDDYLKLDVSNFTRTVPVNTAAFARLTEHVDFFFVPYRLVWRWFPDMIANVQNIDTSYCPDGANVPQGVPYITGDQILRLLNGHLTGSDIYGFPLAQIFYRLLDQLGFPVRSTLADTLLLYADGTSYNQAHYNPIRLFAFARLYHDYYRNSDYETNDPSSYNLDCFHSNTLVSDSALQSLAYAAGWFYHLWSKDMFTSVKPSCLNGNSSVISVKNTFGGTTVNNPNDTFTTIDGSIDGAAVDDAQVSSDVSAAGIRNMFAMDKLARISMLAPKTVQAQLQAHFGVAPYNPNLCQYLGSFDSNIQIGDVIATAAGRAQVDAYQNEQSSMLGQIAGRGISSGHLNQPINYQAKEHGLVIGVHYVLPQSEYDSCFLDSFNTKLGVSDYYVPEYDALGLQPITVGQIGDALKNAVPLTQVLGYQSRYMEYKSRVDVCHGQFASNGALKAWSCSRQNETATTMVGLSKWLHVSPKVTNSLFPVFYNGDPLTDAFLCHYRFDVTKVSNMSINGIPSL